MNEPRLRGEGWWWRGGVGHGFRGGRRHTHTFTLIHINMQFTLLNNLSVFHILPDINQRDDADDRTGA